LPDGVDFLAIVVREVLPISSSAYAVIAKMKPVRINRNLFNSSM
jgi:hypothetical protein